MSKWNHIPLTNIRNHFPFDKLSGGGNGAARAAATFCARTSSPLRRTAEAIPSRAFSFSDTGALAASARTCSTSAMPPGNWAAAQAECEDVQYWQLFSPDT
jgi:hypothetical protein